METISLPILHLDGTPLLPLVGTSGIDVTPLGRMYSVPTYIAGTNQWVPTYIAQHGGDLLTMNCEVNLIDTMYSCKCHLAHETIGNVICGGTPVAKSPLLNELQDCRISIADKIVQSVKAMKSVGGFISSTINSPYCRTYLDSETSLAIPIHTIGKKPRQKEPGYHYTPTWMADVPEWAFPMYSVGNNMLALCKARLKDSQLSCECTIYSAKDKNRIMYCPSRNSVPITKPLDIHQTQHCELHLSLDEVSILALKTKEERLDPLVASKDMTWPCWAKKELDIAETLLELADKGRVSSVVDEDIPSSLTATGYRKSTAQIKQRSADKHLRQASSDILKAAATAGLDTSLPAPILKRQLEDLKRETDMMDEADNIMDPEKRAIFIDMKTKKYRVYLQRRQYRDRLKEKDRLLKSVATDEVGMTISGSHERMHDVVGLTRHPSLTEPLTHPRSRHSSADSLGEALSKALDEPK